MPGRQIETVAKYSANSETLIMLARLLARQVAREFLVQRQSGDSLPAYPAEDILCPD